MIMRLVSLALMLSLIGCTLPRDDYEDFLSQNDGIEDLGIGPWKNEYPDDQRVVGIWIQQFPDGGDASPYEGKHPCMVYYIFPDGRQHGFHYEPDGITESPNHKGGLMPLTGFLSSWISCISPRCSSS